MFFLVVWPVVIALSLLTMFVQLFYYLAIGMFYLIWIPFELAYRLLTHLMTRR